MEHNDDNFPNETERAVMGDISANTIEFLQITRDDLKEAVGVLKAKIDEIAWSAGPTPLALGAFIVACIDEYSRQVKAEQPSVTGEVAKEEITRLLQTISTLQDNRPTPRDLEIEYLRKVELVVWDHMRSSEGQDFRHGPWGDKVRRLALDYSANKQDDQ